MFSAEELRSKAEAARQRRVEVGIADGVEMAQPHDAPAFDTKDFHHQYFLPPELSQVGLYLPGCEYESFLHNAPAAFEMVRYV